ncbi:MAG: phage holin family protein [Acidobacteria bacterium]|nr:phage holin family protein [Acidobacteriota bacterium]
MATYEPSIANLIKSALQDAQDLIRDEIALAKAEARDEVRRVAAGAVLIATAAVCGILFLVLLLSAVAWGIADGAAWPVWAGFAIVTLVMLVLTLALAFAGQARLAAAQHMPRTVETLKETMQWMRARTS